MLLEPALSTLDEQQLQAVTAEVHTPLMILAPPGSGKTTTLCCRMMYCVLEHQIPPERLLALTFSNRACTDMHTKFRALQEQCSDAFSVSGIHIRTFHGWCLSLLLHVGAIPPTISVWDSGQQIAAVKKAVESLDRDTREDPNLSRGYPCPPELAKDILMKISYCRTRLEGPEQSPSGGLLRDTWEQYNRLKVINNALDFDDMMEALIRHAQDHPGFVDELRARFEHVVVDEVYQPTCIYCPPYAFVYSVTQYQDTNYLQLEVLKLLSINITIVGGNGVSPVQFYNICIVCRR